MSDLRNHNPIIWTLAAVDKAILSSVTGMRDDPAPLQLYDGLSGAPGVVGASSGSSLPHHRLLLVELARGLNEALAIKSHTNGYMRPVGWIVKAVRAAEAKAPRSSEPEEHDGRRSSASRSAEKRTAISECKDRGRTGE
jgi:hypothetical protein